MSKLNFGMINEEIIRQKQAGVPIKQSAVNMGFSPATYYRWVKRNGECTWVDVKDDERVFVGSSKLKKRLEETHGTKQKLAKRQPVFTSDSDESTDTSTTVITKKPKKRTPIKTRTDLSTKTKPQKRKKTSTKSESSDDQVPLRHRVPKQAPFGYINKSKQDNLSNPKTNLFETECPADSELMKHRKMLADL